MSNLERKDTSLSPFPSLRFSNAIHTEGGNPFCADEEEQRSSRAKLADADVVMGRVRSVSAMAIKLATPSESPARLSDLDEPFLLRSLRR